MENTISLNSANSIYDDIWDSHENKDIDKTEKVLHLRGLLERIAIKIVEVDDTICLTENEKLNLYQRLKYIFDNFKIPSQIKKDLGDFRRQCNQLAHGMTGYSDYLYMIGVRSIVNFVKFISNEDVPSHVSDIFELLKEKNTVNEAEELKVDNKRCCIKHIIIFLFDINSNEEYFSKLVCGVRQLNESISKCNTLKDSVDLFVINSGKMIMEHNMIENAFNVSNVNTGLLSSINLMAASKMLYREEGVDYINKSWLIVYRDNFSTTISELAKRRIGNLVNDNALKPFPIKLTKAADLELFNQLDNPIEPQALDLNRTEEMFDWFLSSLKLLNL